MFVPTKAWSCVLASLRVPPGLVTEASFLWPGAGIVHLFSAQETPDHALYSMNDIFYQSEGRKVSDFRNG